MNWFIRVADINYKALGFNPNAETYLKSLNNWDRGTAIELSKITNEKDVSRLEYHLNNYKTYLSLVQGKIPNRFLFFIYGWLTKGQIRLPEDLGRLTNALTAFTQQNRKFELKNLQQYPSLGDLEVAVDKVLGVKDVESKRQVTKNIKMQGSQEIYRDEEWRVLKMTTPEAVCELGKGTKWCTNGDADGYKNAKMYLESGPLFLFLHNNGGKWEKYAQATSSFDQVMDILDRPINKPIPSFISVNKSLAQKGLIKKQDFFNNYAFDVSYKGVDKDFADIFMESSNRGDGKFPSDIFDKIREYAGWFGRLSAVEDEIIFNKIPFDEKSLKSYGLTDGKRIEKYLDAVAARGLRWKDPSQEIKIINSTYAFDYWKDRYSDYNFGRGLPGKGDYTPWPEYEAAMLNNFNRSKELVEYLWFLNGSRRTEPRFEEYFLEAGKRTGSQEASIRYAKNCNFRWAELEKIIIDGGNLWEMCDYAKVVIKGRWPEIEPFILSSKDKSIISYYESSFGFSPKASSKEGWYKKADFPEYNVFHGTGNQNSIQERGFVYDYIGQGNDQYGPGFYFTSKRETAGNYGQEGPYPGVIQAKVNLKKPIQISSGHIEQSNAFDIYPSLTVNQTRGLLKLAVQLEGKQILDNFGDISREGERIVFENMTKVYLGKSSAFILYDLFNKSNFEKALRFISKATGYDGVVVNHGNNIDSNKKNEQWVVAWFPEQIQVIGKNK